MAKRFIDTEIFSDEWFMELSIEGKILWLYMITNCNHAGIISLNKKLCEFQTGIKSLLTVTQELGNRLVTVKKGMYFLPSFIVFQYPNFPNSKVKQQQSAIEILQSYQLFEQLPNSMVTVTKELANTKVSVSKDLLKSYDNEHDNDNDNGIEGGMGGDEKSKPKINIPTIDDFLVHGEKLCTDAGINFDTMKFSIKSKYESWTDDGWKDGNGNEIKNWKSKLGNVLPHLKEIRGKNKTAGFLK